MHMRLHINKYESKQILHNLKIQIINGCINITLCIAHHRCIKSGINIIMIEKIWTFYNMHKK